MDQAPAANNKRRFVSFIEAEASEVATKKACIKDRQWDCRFNTPNAEADELIVQNARQLFEQGRLRYILIGGPEIGTNPQHGDYGCRHVHVAVVTANALARSTVLSMLGIKSGYYCVPRNRTKSIAGWREHHIKPETKIDGNILSLYEAGELPADTKQVWTLRSDEEKKRSVDEILRQIYDDLCAGKSEEELFKLYPRNWTMYGEKVKSMCVQRKDFFKTNGDPHIWLHGKAGYGKSSLIAYIYPKSYKKNLYNRFFDLYKPTEHTHVLLEDLDHAAVEVLSLNFIKTLCDESGFTYDQKYKSAQPARTTVIVTSQFTIRNILDHLDKQIETGEQAKALQRRFWEVRADELHRLLGIKLRNNYELSVLKMKSNNDPGRCFMSWNYLEDMPSLRPLPTPEECQKMIREAYYKQA